MDLNGFLKFMRKDCEENSTEKYEEDKVKKFNNILEFAQDVLEKYEDSKRLDPCICAKEHPIIDVIRILGRSLQTEYLTHLLFTEDESDKLKICYRDIMFDIFNTFEELNIDRYELRVDTDISKNIELRKDVVLPWPWKKERLVDNIVTIGEGRLNGKWVYHRTNHTAILWLPIGITWIDGGNHSISTGIIQGCGTLMPKAIYDISPIYSNVYCDGRFYRRRCDTSIISEVTNLEFAAIFEIGRLMVDNKISF